ncbi:MAG: LCP family protein [Acetivibrio sp.]
MSQFYDDDNADSILREITLNLSKQVMDEMEHNEEQDRNTTKDNTKEPDKKPKKKLSYKKTMIIIASVLVVLVIGVVAAGNYFLNRINYESDQDVEIINDNSLDKSQITEIKDIVPPDSNVINVLLIGEEKMKDRTRGRSDSMMIATINQTQKTVKLTSLMRDCYVSIPEHGQGKMNSAYNIGGGPLLLSTIEQNFEIHLNGYARVDFDAFETIVNKLKGVEIELSEAEANYLNVKDYISKPEFRTVKPGVQLLNGNQALGYSRVRYVAGIDGEKDDFGRTNRQRTVLNAIFEKYKKKNLFELVSITNEILPYITTDLSKTEILSYVAAFVGTGTTELETFRLPLDDGFTNVKNNQGWVLMLNYEKNNAAFHEFIYGVTAE